MCSLAAINVSVSSELTRQWWEWFYSTPTETENQHDLYPNKGDVRFLVSNVDGRDTNLTLNASVEKDKTVLFPAAKWISLGFPFQKDEDLIQAAKERIDTLENRTVTIDGEPINAQRVTTDVFSLNLRRDIVPPPTAYQKVKKIRKGRYKAVGDGYWILLSDLEPGLHKIHTHVACAQNIVRIDVHHNLAVFDSCYYNKEDRMIR
jgi:hypothetical protein